ncbi:MULTISPECIES: type II toxin-antitoxin system prevent-host-death family antitoxin [unclassified Streptomyces]|uniref:type II toxin-antitoxin system prevent-host-death family antitoxin n=1 Tax=unclassified Streptomyces TaxID=2593676 RepID=UPI000F744F56|nr:MULTISPECIES: type II toxin-antitoxin system prevent-host-death family antitoxin [unclassified Streptomyces]
MMKITADEAAVRLDDPVRRLSGGPEPVAVTVDGGVTALLVDPAVIQGMEDALAVARRRGCQPVGSRNSRRLPTGSSE